MTADRSQGLREWFVVAAVAAVVIACAWWSVLISDATAGLVWNPAAGVAMAAVVLGGWRHVVGVVAAAWVATSFIDVTMFDVGRVGDLGAGAPTLLGTLGPGGAFVFAATTGGVFALGGLALRAVGLEPALTRYRDVGLLFIASWVAPVAAGLLGVLVLQEHAFVPSLVETAGHVAESATTGIVSVTPAILLVAAARRRRVPLFVPPTLRSPMAALELLAIVAIPLVAILVLDEVNLLFVVALPFLITLGRRGQPAGAIVVAFQAAATATLLGVFDRSADREELVLVLWLASGIALVLGREVEVRARDHRTERHLLAALQGSSDMVFLVDPTGHVFWMNQAAKALRPDDAELQFHTVVEGGQAVLSAVSQILLTEPSWNGDSTFLAADGSTMPVWVTVTPDEVHGDTITGFSVVARDMTEHQKLTADLTRRALYDDLTGVANRSLLSARLDDAIVRSQRTKRTLAVLLIDLDRFKVINDSLGHAFGDDVLIAVVERLRHRIRASDTLARLGGDEFCVVAEDLDDIDDGIGLAHELVDLLGQPFEVDGRSIVLGGSIGVVQGHPNVTSIELLRRADLAMYDAKARGGGQQSLFDSALAAGAERRLRVENHLRMILPIVKLDHAVQPVVDVRRGRIDRGEALLRISHPELGPLSPVEVLDVVRDAGLVDEFTRASVRSIADLATRLPADFRLSFNLSPDQIRSPAIVDLVADAIADFELPPERLSVEITEDAFLEDARGTAEMIRSLQELGCTIALDDFGSGWSSLVMLQLLDFDVLKLDQTLLADIVTSDAARSIVETAVSLAARLGLDVVAEGIESAAQAEAATAAGVQWLQGYHLHRPMPMSALHDLLAPEAPQPT